MGEDLKVDPISECTFKVEWLREKHLRSQVAPSNDVHQQ